MRVFRFLENFLGCLQPAIPGLISALHDNDRNVWSTAVGVLSVLSGHGALGIFFVLYRFVSMLGIDEFRKPLVPALAKLIQQLSQWGEDEENLLDLTANVSFTKDLHTLISNFRTYGNVPLLFDQLECSFSFRASHYEETHCACIGVAHRISVSISFSRNAGL
jgi:hypothetical protein